MTEYTDQLFEDLKRDTDWYNKMYKDFLSYKELNVSNWTQHDEVTGKEFTFYDIMRLFYRETSSGVSLIPTPNYKNYKLLINFMGSLPDRMQKIKEEINLRDQHAQIRKDRIDELKTRVYNYMVETRNKYDRVRKENKDLKHDIETMEKKIFKLQSDCDTEYFRGQNDILKEQGKKKNVKKKKFITEN